jgi:hypothetical protein
MLAFIEVEGIRDGLYKKYLINVNNIIEIEELYTEKDIIIYTLNKTGPIHVESSLKEFKIKINQIKKI